MNTAVFVLGKPVAAYVHALTYTDVPCESSTQFCADGILDAVVRISSNRRILIRVPGGLSFSQRYFPHVGR